MRLPCSSPKAANDQKFVADFFVEASTYALGESEYKDLRARLKTLRTKYLKQQDLQNKWSGLELSRYLESEALKSVSAPGLKGSQKENFKDAVQEMVALSHEASQ